MNERDLEAAVLRALDSTVSLEGRPVDPDCPLSEQFDLDPERFFGALARETGIDVPAGHRSRLMTLEGCLGYLAGRLSG